MAEEPQSAPTTPVQQPQAQNNVIPDSILQEIEKVAKMEKDITFLQYRQGSVEKSLTQLQDTLGETSDKSPATEKNVIEDAETKEDKKSEKKEDKDVLKSDKLKPQLTTVEKKRYENIGLEFAKGTQKIFKEIRQAEELKQKMATNKVEDVKKEEKKEEKKEKKDGKEGGLGSLFLKLGLAISAVSIILETFKDKIDLIIPDFRIKWDKFTKPIKDVGDVITTSITNFLDKTIKGNISDLFSTVGSGITIFFTRGLPQAIYLSGLVVAQAFGAKITDDMKKLDASLTSKTDTHLKRGMSLTDAMTIVNNPFATDKDLEKVRRSSGLTAIENSFSSDDLMNLGELLMLNDGYTQEQIEGLRKNPEVARGFITPDVANTLMSVIKENGMFDNDGKIDEDELKKIHQSLGITEDFETWKNRTEVQSIFKPNVVQGSDSILRSAFDKFTAIHTQWVNQPHLEEAYNQMETSLRTEGLQKNEKTNKVEMTVEPVEVAQNIFASELVQVYELFKSIFSGNNFSSQVINSISSVVQYTYNNFLEPFITLIHKMIDYCNIWSSKYEQTKKPNQSGSSGGKPSTTGKVSTPKSNFQINGTGNNPIVLIDFTLDETVLGTAKEIASNTVSLLGYMQQVNTNLGKLRTISLSEAENTNQKEIQSLKIIVADNMKNISDNTGRIGTIENYLEAHDGDNINENDQLKFTAKQAQPTAPSQ